MPDTQRHRGSHPSDKDLFAEPLNSLRTALYDLSWLLSKGYAQSAALKIVGDRYNLRKRQRMALYRSACSEQKRKARIVKQCSAETLSGQHLGIDAFNCIISFEAMISGGAIFIGQDGVRRDLASVHGSYRQVEETDAAIAAIEAIIAPAAQVSWYLDRPVSNSGRLAVKLRAHAQSKGHHWQVHVVNNPDRELVALENIIIASSDSWVLDKSKRWIDLSSSFKHPDLWLIDLRKSHPHD